MWRRWREGGGRGREEKRRKGKSVREKEKNGREQILAEHCNIASAATGQMYDISCTLLRRLITPVL